MNFTILTSEVVQTLFTTIRKLQTKIAELKILQTSSFIFSQDDNMNLLLILKSEKFSDSLMFSDDRKKLHSFIIKLCLKFKKNADQFSTNIIIIISTLFHYSSIECC